MNRLVILLLLLLWSCLAFCQNPVYNSIRFSGSDSTSYSLPVNVGNVRYDAVTGKYRFWNNVTDTWFSYSLSGGGAPGGSAGSIQTNDGAGGFNGANMAVGTNSLYNLVAGQNWHLGWNASGSGGSVDARRLTVGTLGISIGSFLTEAVTPLHVEKIISGASGAVVGEPFRVRTTFNTATPEIGAGTRIDFETETANNNYEVGASIEALTTDVTAASEDFDLVFKTMSAGATASERFRISAVNGINVTDGQLHVNRSTLGDQVLKLSTNSPDDDPAINVYQNRIVTSTATPTTMHIVLIPASTTVTLEATIVARRFGGTAGTAEDGASYKKIATFKTVAGTVTMIGAVTTIHSAEDQAGWDVIFTPAAANVQIQVIGELNNSITWHLSELKVMQVSL